MSATLKDVASLAGVSYATVSRVLAGKPNIRPETVTRVERAVAELGYRPNRTAQALQRRRSQLIGIVISDIRYGFFPPLVRAMEDRASQAGFSVILCNSDENPAKQEHYLELLVRENVAGAIIAPTGDDFGFIDRLHRAGVALVLVDRSPEENVVDAVVVDNAEASYEATSHLYQNGYRRVAAIMGAGSAMTARQRLDGFRRAVIEHAGEYDPSLVVGGDPRPEAGDAAVKTLLSLPDPPDAVFIGNHLLAGGALRALAGFTGSAGQPLGIVIFDDPEWASFVKPAVTAIAQPGYEMGAAAMEMLLARVRGASGPARHAVLKTSLHVRSSSSPRGLTHALAPGR